MRNFESKTAFLYGRVSTTDQKDNGYSLPQQKEYLHDFCKKRGIEVLEYFEEDYTSTTFERPQYKKILRKCKTKKPDLILFHKWDRFSREPEGIPEVEKLLAKGIEPNSITEWINFSDASYYIYLGIYILSAKVENRKRSDRTKDGILGALKEGRHVNKAQIGYINGKDPHNTSKPLIKICPDKGPLIKAIFEEYATGQHTQEYLRRKYYKLGIKRCKSQFSNLLSNIKYMGKLIVPANNGEPMKVITALHEPIVDEATYLMVQNVKLGKVNIRFNAEKKSKYEEILPLRSGVLKCKQCGSNLTGSPSRSRNGEIHFYYHCNPKKGCKERFPIEIAHNELNNILTELKPRKAVVELFKVIIEDEYKNSIKNNLKVRTNLKKELLSIEDKLDTLTEKYRINTKSCGVQIKSRTLIFKIYKFWRFQLML